MKGNRQAAFKRHSSRTNRNDWLLLKHCSLGADCVLFFFAAERAAHQLYAFYLVNVVS